MFVAFCLSVCCCCLPVLYVVVLAYEYVFVVVYQCICCCFGLRICLLFVLFTSECFCYFCLPVNFAITERESHHVMVVSENETWIWRGRIVTMPLPSGF